jgi:GNAT superfamily N-acetyltransferase
MLLARAIPSDHAEIVDLANLAYRGTGPTASWNIETGLIAGQRLTESLLEEEISAKPESFLLTYRDEPGGPNIPDSPLLGTVWLEPKADGVWYLGLLTIRPELQNRQLGRALLAAAEDFAKSHGACRISMTVVNLRESLIAWYLRRGYGLTGETQPFPREDERFGKPLRDDLHFVVLKKDL